MRDHDNSMSRERWVGGIDEMEEDDFEITRQSSKHKIKDKSKSGHRDDKDHKSKDREREKTSHASKDREKESKEVDKDHFSRRDGRKEDKDELEREKNRVQERDTDRDLFKDRERDRKDRSKEKERDKDVDREIDPDRVRDKDRRKDKTREKEREKDRDRNREREIEIDHDRSRNVSEKDKIKERTREKGKEKEYDRSDDKPRDKDVRSHKQRDENHERSRDSKLNDKPRTVGGSEQDASKQARGSKNAEDESEAHQTQHTSNDERARSHGSAKELEDRIQKMKEERLKKKSETASEVETWVSRSRKLEKERVLDLSKKFEEQDNVNEEDSDDDDNLTQHTTHDLSGVKVLHGIDKVLEGGAVVLTLKDQSILAAGGVNEDLDELENIEIGEQKKRNEAYEAAKKKKGVYVDKFLDEPGSEKKMLPQYDDPIADEGITLDASGRFTGEAEKKLEELRKRIQGVPASRNFEDLNAPGRLLSDYYTPDEMLKFKKPKKKKSLRKKEKLDVDALEAEAVSSGLGVGDLGSRNDSKLQALKEQRERSEAEIRSSAYQAALAKADEASKTLRLGQIPLAESEEIDAPAIGDDDEEMQRSLARARRIALTKQEEVVKSGPQALAMLASSTTNESGAENQNSAGAESQEKKIVFTEMEGFFLALQQDEARAPDGKDVFMEEDDVPNTYEKEAKEEDSVWSEVKESVKVELSEKKEEEIAPDETIHEVAVGKGLAGALKLLKDRGALKESVEWGGRNMDKKKSKLAGIYDEGPMDKKKSKLSGISDEGPIDKKKSKLAGIYDEGPKEIHIERTDEYGRILTPKESFRLLSHKFHGKGPGKMKQEKRMRQYQEELKVKQMANSDTPTHSVQRMREAQAQQKTPYLVLSGNVKPGQNSDPRSGFATVEKDFPGSLTPMLGDKKVEYLLGKRKPGAGDTGSQKKPKT